MTQLLVIWLLLSLPLAVLVAKTMRHGMSSGHDGSTARSDRSNAVEPAPRSDLEPELDEAS